MSDITIGSLHFTPYHETTPTEAPIHSHQVKGTVLVDGIYAAISEWTVTGRALTLTFTVVPSSLMRVADAPMDHVTLFFRGVPSLYRVVSGSVAEGSVRLGSRIEHAQ